jgi:hypothetical protein
MPTETELRKHRCCFTGHRPGKLDLSEKQVKAAPGGSCSLDLCHYQTDPLRERGGKEMKKGLALLLLSLCFLPACREKEPSKELLTYVSPEDCRLCGRMGESPWGQDNVGLISLNTFEMIPIEINRYDDKGVLIEENTGCARVWNFQSEEGGFRASGIEDPDRGYAMVSVTLEEDETADREKAAAFLCEDCLERILPEDGTERTGLGMVDLTTREVQTFDSRTLGFGLGDFYIHCDRKEEGGRAELLIFFSPLRYGEG